MGPGRGLDRSWGSEETALRLGRRGPPESQNFEMNGAPAFPPTAMPTVPAPRVPSLHMMKGASGLRVSGV